jgi:hypothetical protein
VNAAAIVNQWTAAVKDLFPNLHAHQSKALAALSYAMAASGHVDSGRVAAALPTCVKPASVVRRMERLLANPRLHPARAAADLTRSLLGNWPADRPLVLILDETPQSDTLRCMKLSVGYRRRAVPLAWACYLPQQPPEPMPQLLWHLLHRVARCLSPGRPVTLLADRGLSWPVVLDCCERLGWHYVLRMQGQTRLRLADGRELCLADLTPAKGMGWCGSGQVFKKADWRQVNVAATWDKACKEPWLLVSDLPATLRRCGNYAKRVWREQLHRDEKSQGFNWQRSHVRRPGHAQRLVLAMALATLLALSLGTRVLKRGLRRELESGRVRKLSLFQLGLRWLAAMLAGHKPLPCTPYLVPP